MKKGDLEDAFQSFKWRFRQSGPPLNSPNSQHLEQIWDNSKQSNFFGLYGNFPFILRMVVISTSNKSK